METGFYNPNFALQPILLSLFWIKINLKEKTGLVKLQVYMLVYWCCSQLETMQY